MQYANSTLTNGEKVAIKKVFQDARYKNREAEIIKILNHQNIIKLRYSFLTKDDEKDDTYLNLVMDFIPETLSKLIRNYKKQQKQLPDLHIKIYAYQMFRGLAYLKGLGICHRDIKPQNILIDPNSLMLKICDFGSAKVLVKGEQNISYICSRYYRAPELIFKAEQYTTQVDLWSMGCVLVEMVLGEPIFPGDNAVDQLVRIIKIIGTPTQEQIRHMNPEYKEYKFPQIRCHPWSKVFEKIKNIDKDFIDLVSRVLIYSPQERPQPLEVLLHPYFNELRNKKIYENNPNLQDFLILLMRKYQLNQILFQSQFLPGINKNNNDFIKNIFNIIYNICILFI
ncbi:hypothetical protein IMG5_054600 [Ichthyophthirius multifiliis]|uniref:Protein kinase domain-containing protein n=1 Tax=Ichthyophthirius multifiliis TaxID=5932 RepID=G0QN16_ICHMU|nr:hypothetical protein IMG5_054600 [Ichthyophthirius multifiliis]EGR33395.1 hypothetical protein IMG5_054600 [Ichthyophthirius multifiliis]|eukprot:XP_004037381.1 hypothetical protein IMG5_054600 [Ichthyophthirius multifiliis]